MVNIYRINKVCRLLSKRFACQHGQTFIKKGHFAQTCGVLNPSFHSAYELIHALAEHSALFAMARRIRTTNQGIPNILNASRCAALWPVSAPPPLLLRHMLSNVVSCFYSLGNPEQSGFAVFNYFIMI